MMKHLLFLLLALGMTGCAPKEIIREVQVPVKIPTLCISECPLTTSTDTPKTNGELAEAWKDRGNAIECYKARQACVREMSQIPDQSKTVPADKK